MLLQYTDDFWEGEWNKGISDETHDLFILFLTTLLDRCNERFVLKRARPMIPKELSNLLVQSRSLSYSAKRAGGYTAKAGSA